MAILGNLDLALMELTPQSPAKHYLDTTKTITFRMSELTKQILAFSGKGLFYIGTLDLRKLIEEMTESLRTSVPPSIAINFELEDNLPVFQADANQVSQVIRNLVTNAVEAIDTKEGTLWIRIGVMRADRRYLSQSLLGDGRSEGRFVYLEVADTGCGIPKENNQKIFDPFFTTKFIGRGLGLSVVQGIMRGHNGAIHMESEPNHGSTFRVLFPCDEKDSFIGTNFCDSLHH